MKKNWESEDTLDLLGGFNKLEAKLYYLFILPATDSIFGVYEHPANAGPSNWLDDQFNRPRVDLRWPFVQYSRPRTLYRR